jgi:hypothetical protein
MAERPQGLWLVLCWGMGCCYGPMHQQPLHLQQHPSSELLLRQAHPEGRSTGGKHHSFVFISSWFARARQHTPGGIA